MDNQAEQLNSRGYKYLNDKDYVSAYKYFLEAARLGSYNAIYNLGYCNFNGYGVPKNYDKAMNILSEVAFIECPIQSNAQYLCGLIMHRKGEDFDKVRVWYSKAADNGHAWAKFQLGRTYIDENRQLARYYIQEAMKCAPNDYELHSQAKKLLRLITVVNFLK